MPGYAERDMHHGNPKSWLGETNNNNLTPMPKHRHFGYHRMAGHPPPGFFIEDFLIQTVNMQDGKGRTTPSELYRDMFQILLADDWRELYMKESLRDPCDMMQGAIGNEQQEKGIRKVLTNAELHIRNQVKRQRDSIKHSIGFLRHGRSPSFESEMLSIRAHTFFQSSMPAEMMREYLNERNHTDGQLMWVHPMRHIIRSQLLDCLKEHGKATPQTDKQRKQKIEIFEEYIPAISIIENRWRSKLQKALESVMPVHQSLQPGQNHSRLVPQLHG